MPRLVQCCYEVRVYMCMYVCMYVCMNSSHSCAGGSKDVLNEIERNLQDAMQVGICILSTFIYTYSTYIHSINKSYIHTYVGCAECSV